MKNRRFRALRAAGALATGLFLMSSIADATLIVNATVGGAATGTSYENFNSLSLGASGGTTGSGISVSFNPDGQAVQGSSTGTYAAPFLSNNNGAPFGDPTNGPDATTYLSTGVGSATLVFPALEQYMGLLWGSVDLYNTLTFFNGTTLVGSITGVDVTASANGNQGANGTFYVNINSTLAFDSVVASSSGYAFEFDNVAFNPTQVSVPEPGAIGLLLLGLVPIGLGFMRQRRNAG